ARRSGAGRASSVEGPKGGSRWEWDLEYPRPEEKDPAPARAGLLWGTRWARLSPRPQRAVAGPEREHRAGSGERAGPAGRPGGRGMGRRAASQERGETASWLVADVRGDDLAVEFANPGLGKAEPGEGRGDRTRAYNLVVGGGEVLFA